MLRMEKGILHYQILVPLAIILVRLNLKYSFEAALRAVWSNLALWLYKSGVSVDEAPHFSFSFFSHWIRPVLSYNSWIRLFILCTLFYCCSLLNGGNIASKSGQHELGFERTIASKPCQIREIDTNVPVIQPVSILNGLGFDKYVQKLWFFFSDTKHLLRWMA